MKQAAGAKNAGRDLTATTTCRRAPDALALVMALVPAVAADNRREHGIIVSSDPARRHAGNV